MMIYLKYSHNLWYFDCRQKWNMDFCSFHVNVIEIHTKHNPETMTMILNIYT